MVSININVSVVSIFYVKETVYLMQEFLSVVDNSFYKKNEEPKNFDLKSSDRKI
jgi:ABC-type polysaccharide/polyol phosphate transport system ATPase subunit